LSDAEQTEDIDLEFLTAELDPSRLSRSSADRVEDDAGLFDRDWSVPKSR
jgi:hypothetical protein